MPSFPDDFAYAKGGSTVTVQTSGSLSTVVLQEMDPETKCPACQIIVEAMNNWVNGLMSDAFEVPLGTFAGFEERRNCKTCGLVVQHFRTNPRCHPFRPSCSLIFSRNKLRERFWVEPVSFATNPSFVHTVFNIIRLCFVGKDSTLGISAKNLMAIWS